MNRIDATFAALQAAGRTALIPYVTAGDPSLAATLPILQALAAAGADVIELGVPFSDPMADGPVIQRASERALAQGVGLNDVLAIVSAFRQRNATTPLVLMGYANPIEAMGATSFADRAQAAGVDGVIVVDYPPEEAGEFAALLEARGHRPDFPALADHAGGPHRHRRCARARLRVLRIAQGGHRRRAPRHRRRHREARRNSQAYFAADRRRVWHSRCGGRAGHRGARGRSGDRQPHHPGNRIGPADQAAARAGAWLATIRSAIDAVSGGQHECTAWP